MDLLRIIAKNAVIAYRTATSSLRLLPDFIIIGAARGGTTSLYNYLVQHPTIAPALRKEVHFFDYNYQYGLSWYQGHFPALPYKQYMQATRRQKLIAGEATPYYLFHPYAPQRTAQLLPRVQLIALLRNPIERAFSHYCWEVAWGNEHLSFEDALEREEGRLRGTTHILKNGKSFNHIHFSYVSRGRYAEQLARWFACFPREQILIVKSEDMYNDPVEIFTQTLNFLGVARSKNGKGEFKQYNRQKLPIDKEMLPATRQRLLELFQPHNEQLYNLLGKDFGWQ